MGVSYLYYIRRMYLMYVDESGDCGLVNSPTNHFVLSGIVIHESQWRNVLSSLVKFRRYIKNTKGLKIREEIHANAFISKPKTLSRIKRNDRLDILKKCLEWIENQQEIKIISVVINKSNKSGDIFDMAWNTLITRFENTINSGNFKLSPNPQDKGLIICDNTDAIKLRGILRRMRHINTIPSKIYQHTTVNVQVQSIIEDPVFRDSSNSFMHQMADVLAYFVRQKHEPNSYIRNKGAVTFYDKLSGCVTKQVSRQKNGIVYI